MERTVVLWERCPGTPPVSPLCSQGHWDASQLPLGTEAPLGAAGSACIPLPWCKDWGTGGGLTSGCTVVSPPGAK